MLSGTSGEQVEPELLPGATLARRQLRLPIRL
jgi:hypothetical protein